MYRLGYCKLMKVKELRRIVHNYGILHAVQSLGAHKERRAKYGFKELKEVAKPLVKYLRENGNPHQKIIIDQVSVKIISDDVFIPIVEVNKL